MKIIKVVVLLSAVASIPVQAVSKPWYINIYNGVGIACTALAGYYWYGIVRPKATTAIQTQVRPCAIPDISKELKNDAKYQALVALRSKVQDGEKVGSDTLDHTEFDKELVAHNFSSEAQKSLAILRGKYAAFRADFIRHSNDYWVTKFHEAQNDFLYHLDLITSNINNEYQIRALKSVLQAPNNSHTNLHPQISPWSAWKKYIIAGTATTAAITAFYAGYKNKYLSNN